MDRFTTDVFIARQPIFDRNHQVAGYELLYRADDENRYRPEDAEAASSMQLEKTLLTFGFEQLTNGRDAWLNASRTLLTRDHWRLLPASRTVLEVLETVRPDHAIVAACRRAVDAGYRVALDDFTYTSEYEALLELAHVVKVDFRQHDALARRSLVRRLSPRGLTLVAEKVETHAELEEAMGEGYGLFQGYYFCRPQMMHAREVAPSRLAYLRLLREVYSPELDLDKLEQLIQQDVALSIKLLRYLHSASTAWTKDLRTIRQALLQLGERATRQWVALVAVFGLAQGKPPELIIVALGRGRLAAHLARAAGLAPLEDEAFLTGLLSVLDALTDQPLEQALQSIAVHPDVAGALLHGAPPLGDVLRVVLHWERGDWAQAQEAIARLGIEEDVVAVAYATSLKWAEDHASA
jgi:EAL and modified HD-GYP domain-containing signal transduction protein